MIVRTSQARCSRQILNCVQHRLWQAVGFWMAAAVGIEAKASHPLLQDGKPLLQTVWWPGRHSITVSWQD